MTSSLEQAFREAAKLPADEQDALAARLLAELAAEDEFDRAIASTGGKTCAVRQRSPFRASQRANAGT